MKIIEISSIILMVVFFAISFYVYDLVPEKMTVHWNTQGEPDGYGSKFLGLFLLPIIMSVVTLLLLIAPYTDSLQKNIEQFRRYYDLFIVLLLLFMLFVHLAIILWNINIKIEIIPFFTFWTAVLFFHIAILCKKAKQNRIIGVRTPWTLKSTIVWNKTHKLAAKLYSIAALIILSSLFFQKYAFYFILVTVLPFSLILVLYSYLIYRKIKK